MDWAVWGLKDSGSKISVPFSAPKTHTVSCAVGAGSFPGIKGQPHDTDHPSSRARLQSGWSATPASPMCLHGHVVGWPLPSLFLYKLNILVTYIVCISFCSCVQNGYRLSQLVRPLFCITELADTIYCMCSTCISLILHIYTSICVEYWNMLHVENTFVNSKEYILKHKDENLWSN